tara:strand:+ start:41 stop:685 length:645 start_codon:yes stop_codon:yes gene_type:complete
MATILENRMANSGRLILVTPPPAEPVTLIEAKAHLRVSHDDDDLLISSLITAARQHIDGADGWLGRCLVQQTWDLKLDGFPLATGKIILPMAPLIEVVQITYRDSAGATQTLAPSVYQIVDQGTRRSFVTLEPNKSWPGTDDRHDAVAVRFTAGYPDDGDSPADYAANIPAAIKAALLLMIGELYENREAMIRTDLTDNPAVRRLLKPYQVSWL